MSYASMEKAGGLNVLRDGQVVRAVGDRCFGTRCVADFYLMQTCIIKFDLYFIIAFIFL